MDHDGTRDYVQVKLYGSPHGVVKHMVRVQDKIQHGLDGLHGEQVAMFISRCLRIFEMRFMLSRPPGPFFHVSLYHHTIPISPQDAAGVVMDGMSNVGPDQLSHFFNELLCGAVAAGSLTVSCQWIPW